MLPGERTAILPPPPSAGGANAMPKGNLQAGKWLVPTALAGTALYALYKGNNVRDEQEARMQDMTNARQHDLTAALPSMAVKRAGHSVLQHLTGHTRDQSSYDEVPAQKQVLASHEAFTLRKLADLGDDNGALSFSPVAPKFQDVATGALANAVADIGIKRPVNALTGILKKKLYTEPKQKRIFNEVMAGDPELGRTFTENPDIVNRTYKTLKTFGPSLALDHNAVRNFLQQGMTVGGNIDYSTIKMLADTEKTIRQARGEIGGHG